MSGIDTIFESVRVYAQTPNHLEDCLLLISTYPYFLRQEDTTVSRIHGAFAKRSKKSSELLPCMDQRQRGFLRPGL